MSILHSYAVGNGDMFTIRHNTDNFTIIDCSITEEDRDTFYPSIKEQANGKGVSRFISTHPDRDHFMGIEHLDSEIGIINFYCVKNAATKSDETSDFKHYCKLRDADNAFYLYKGCTRKWMNLGGEGRDSSGLFCLWPDTDNQYFKEALSDTAADGSPNNISPIITYNTGGTSLIWFGDLETDFLQNIAGEVEWPKVEILFAPHHGRDSGKIPEVVLSHLDPSIIILGEAPSQNLNYYANYNTITQNSAGSLAFEVVNSGIDIYVGSSTYSVNFLSSRTATRYGNYIDTKLL